uniref:Uncharacterized protein n=1 Tax=Cacopsylla melanoneura TaxID=428564 RepID=A0A8D8VGQ6_9HEMI
MNKEEMQELMQQWCEKINNEVKTSIKTEVKTQVVPFLRKVNTLEKKVNQQDGKINTMDSNLEREKRKRNIIMFNVPLLDNETVQMLENEVLKIFSGNMGVQCSTQDIDFIKRLVKNKPGSNPVLVTFALLKKKLEVLGKRNNLKQTPYYINEDYSEEMRKRRKELFPVVKQMREEGKFALMKFDEIFTKDLGGRLVKVDLFGMSDKPKLQPTMNMGMSTPSTKGKGGKKRGFPVSPMDVQMTGSEEDVYLNKYTPNPKRIADEDYGPEEPEEYSSDTDLNSTIVQSQINHNITMENNVTGANQHQSVVNNAAGTTQNPIDPSDTSATHTQY